MTKDLAASFHDPGHTPGHTPGHAPGSEPAPSDAWGAGDINAEALAARVSAAIANVSTMDDVRIHGAGAAALLSAACRTELSQLAAGRSLAVHWCADGGGVRGMGVVSRFGETNFLLRAHDADMGWFAPAAERFGATVRNASTERRLFMVAGPYAWAVLAAAGLEAAAYLKALDHAIYDLGGAAVTVFGCEMPSAYLLSCAPDDGEKLFGRLMRGGQYFGLRRMSEAALSILLMEEGVLVPHLDFEPARAPFAKEPLPAPLGLGSFSESSGRILVGLELESDAPAAFAGIFHDGQEIGRTMRSLYSPALHRAVALASLSRDWAAPGTTVAVRHCAGGTSCEIAAKVARLPFF